MLKVKLVTVSHFRFHVSPFFVNLISGFIESWNSILAVPADKHNINF
jgi:hypothetical protein